jgi:hypothetical protein
VWGGDGGGFRALIYALPRPMPSPHTLAHTHTHTFFQLWDDAEDSSGSDILVAAMQVLPAVAETGWSAQGVVRGNAPDKARWTDARCRMATRFITSHPAPYSDIGQWCTVEYQGLPAPWDV